MHKTFIGFFIPSIYIIYCTMFHGMNNQFEVLGVKNGMTTTVIKAIGNFTTVNSITNDVMDWEFTITNSLTKMVKKKMGLSGHHKEKRKKKRACLLRPQFKQKKFAAGRLPNLVWQSGQTSRDVQDVQNVWDVARPQRPISYIYIAPPQINSFSL